MDPQVQLELRRLRAALTNLLINEQFKSFAVFVSKDLSKAMISIHNVGHKRIGKYLFTVNATDKVMVFLRAN